MAGLTDLLNPEDPYRKSLEGALYNRQADTINTQADRAQNQGRENAFGRGVGFSSILPDYSTAPIERERFRALNNAGQNAFLGAGQEARANLAATNQPNQFAQSQAQQAGQFQQMMQQQRRQLGQQANQNLVASLGGGAAGLATLLLRPQPAGSSTLGGTLGSGIWDSAGRGANWLGDMLGLGGPEQLGGGAAVLGNLSSAAPDIASAGIDAGQAAIDPATLDSLLALLGGGLPF